MKIKLEREYVLAAMCNGKEITEAAFEAQVGVPFNEFWNKNKKKCLAAWRVDQKLKERPVSLETKYKRGECVCDDEEKLPPNSGNKNTGALHRLWHCPLHGNRMQDLTNQEK